MIFAACNFFVLQGSSRVRRRQVLGGKNVQRHAVVAAFYLRPNFLVHQVLFVLFYFAAACARLCSPVRLLAT